MIPKIFSRLVTALSSGRSVQTHCCTSGHRTEGRLLRSTTLRMNLRLAHSQRRQDTGRRGQRLQQAVGPGVVTLTASTRKVNTPEYTQMILKEPTCQYSAIDDTCNVWNSIDLPCAENTRENDWNCRVMVSYHQACLVFPACHTYPMHPAIKDISDGPTRFSEAITYEEYVVHPNPAYNVIRSMLGRQRICNNLPKSAIGTTQAPSIVDGSRNSGSEPPGSPPCASRCRTSLP